MCQLQLKCNFFVNFPIIAATINCWYSPNDIELCMLNTQKSNNKTAQTG